MPSSSIDVRQTRSRFRGCATVLFLAAAAQWFPDAKADSLVTSRGDVLYGQLIRIDGQSAIFVRGGQSSLKVPLADIVSLKTDGPFELVIGARERLSGLLTVDLGKWRVSTPYGDVSLGLAEIEAGNPASDRKNPPAVVAGASLDTVTGRGDPPTASAPSAAGDVDKDSSAPPRAAPEKNAGAVKDDGTQDLSFLRTEAVLLTDRQVAADFSIGYLRNEHLFQSDRALIANFGIRANLLPNLEAFVTGPLVLGERTLYLDRALTDRDSGIGDVRVGAKYRLFSQTAQRPETIFSFSILAPTGKAPYYQPPAVPADVANALTPVAAAATVDPRDPYKFPLGGGHWAANFGAMLFRTFDPIVLFGGVDFTHTFPATYFGTRVSPGDRYNATLGLGFAVSERSTLSQQLYFQYEAPWLLNSEKLLRSGGSPVALRMAYTHRLDSGSVIEPSIQFGLTSDATNAVFSLAYTKRF